MKTLTVSIAKIIDHCWNQCFHCDINDGPGSAMICLHPQAPDDGYIISHPECDTGFPEKCPLIKIEESKKNEIKWMINDHTIHPHSHLGVHKKDSVCIPGPRGAECACCREATQAEIDEKFIRKLTNALKDIYDYFPPGPYSVMCSHCCDEVFKTYSLISEAQEWLKSKEMGKEQT